MSLARNPRRGDSRTSPLAGTLTPLTDVSHREAAQRADRWRVSLTLAPLLAVLIPCLVLLGTIGGAFRGGPSGVAFEADFAMFLSGARITLHGGNPYDHALLFRTDRAMLAREGLPITKSHALVRVGNPPLLFWALQPLTRFPFQTVALAWLALMSACSVVGFLASLRYLGWRRKALPLLVFAVMPQVLLGPFYGNVICLVFAGISLGLWLARRHPVAAGALLVLAWLKPPVALPFVLLVVFLHPSRRSRILAGFGAGTAGMVVATAFLLGWRPLGWWLAAMAGYSHGVNMWPDMVSLAGLYAHAAGDHLRLALQLTCVLSALGITGWLWRTAPSSITEQLWAFATLSFVWLLATPYAHPFDEVLLTVPILILVGRDGRHVTRSWSACALYLMGFAVLLMPVTPHGISLLPLPLLAVACVVLEQRNGTAGEIDSKWAGGLSGGP